MFKPEVYILSAPVNSGKTTILKNWLVHHSVGGVLSPKINGKRFFENISAGETFLMDSIDGFQVGKFTFSSDAFEFAQKIILKEIDTAHDWLIIDEIGPLEIKQNLGFHDILLKVFNSLFKNPKKILLVVRDSSVSDFLEKYNLVNSKILPLSFFSNNSFTQIDEKLPIGIVLAGGVSSRMKQDKALLGYYGISQLEYVTKMLKPFCNKVFISCNAKQLSKWRNQFPNFQFMVDEEEFVGNGPLTGLLTASKNHKNSAFFLVAIDYPKLEQQHLIELNNARESGCEAVCFSQDGFTEPLVSIIESSAIDKLAEFYQAGHNSISAFLKSIKLKTLDVKDRDFLTNINSAEEFAKFTQQQNLKG